MSKFKYIIVAKTQDGRSKIFIEDSIDEVNDAFTDEFDNSEIEKMRHIELFSAHKLKSKLKKQVGEDHQVRPVKVSYKDE